MKVLISVLLLSFLVFSKEFLLLDEDILLVISFSLFIYFAYQNLSGILSTFFKERGAEISLSFENLFTQRLENLNVLHQIFKNRLFLEHMAISLVVFFRELSTKLGKVWSHKYAGYINYRVQSFLLLIAKEELKLLQNYYRNCLLIWYANVLSICQTTLKSSSSYEDDKKLLQTFHQISLKNI